MDSLRHRERARKHALYERNREEILVRVKTYALLHKGDKKAYDSNRRLIVKQYVDQAKACPCVDCGLCYPPVAMDFDHRPGEIKAGCVGTIAASGRLRLVVEEINKCDLVCALCHRARTECRRSRKDKVSKDQKYIRKLRELTDRYKSVPCDVCGRKAEPGQMEFDHIDPSTKSACVSDLVGKRAALSKIMAEIAKCRVLCIICHRVHSFGVTK